MDYLNHLLAIAKTQEPIGHARIASVLVDKKGNIVCYGRNSRKTHPLQKLFSKNDRALFLHAEIDAIRKLLRLHETTVVFWGEYTLYIARSKSDRFGRWVSGSAAPCVGCQKALRYFGIRWVST